MSEETKRGSASPRGALEEVEALADVYGGDPDQWPPSARRALDAASGDRDAVADILAQARRLDALLAREADAIRAASAEGAAAPEALRDRLLADYGAALGPPAAEPAASKQGSTGWFAALASVADELKAHLGAVGASMVGAAAAAGLAVGVFAPAGGDAADPAAAASLFEMAASFAPEVGDEGATTDLSVEDEWGVLLMDAADG